MNTTKSYNATSQQQLNLLEILINYIVSFYVPFVSVVGIMGNILILIIMGQEKIQIAKSARVYYIIISVGDLGSLIFFYCRYFLSVGLWFLTSGNFHITTYSIVLCKIWMALYYFFFIVSMYTLIAFSIERNFALYFPMQHRASMNTAMQFIILLICVGIPSAFLLPTAVGAVGVVFAQNAYLPICGGDPKSPFFTLFAFTSTVFAFELPEISTAILIISIILKMNKIRTERQKLAQGSTLLSSAEVRTIMTLLSVALINVIIFLPTSVLHAIAATVRSINSLSSTAQFWVTLFQIGLLTAGLIHALNLFVYIIQIPSFRGAIFCIPKK